MMAGRWTPIDEPVVRSGAPEGWDGLSAITPGIFAGGAGKKFGMFYVGLSARSDTWGIGYAGSDDLLSWEKPGADPLISSEDEESCVSYDSPCLVRKDGRFHLFCEEKKKSKSAGAKIKHLLPLKLRMGIGRLRRSLKGKEARALSVQHADKRYFVSFSTDRLLEWDTGAKRIAFDKGEAGSFDAEGLFSPQVHELEGRYYMFYGGSDGSATSTGLDVSDDLVSWERRPSPVLKTGGKGEWDEKNALIVSVLKVDDGYCGFYEGEDANNTYSIGLAVSSDLKGWEKFEGTRIIKNGGKGSFSEKMAFSPHIFAAEGKVLLFYTGHDRYMRGSCGAAIFEKS